MAKREKFEPLTTSDDDSNYELDLSPLLALMVTLIPVMLLAAEFVKITVLTSDLPQVVQQAVEQDRNKKTREVNIELAMNNNKSFVLTMTDSGRVLKKFNITKRTDTWNYDELHKRLVQVKLKAPKTFRVDLTPGDQVTYNDIVKVMDEARNSKPGEANFKIVDPKSKQEATTNVMFPDVIFSNVIGG